MPTILEHLAALFDKDMRAVLSNPRTISMIANPSARVQMAAVRRDRSVICFIEKPTEKVQLTAVRNAPHNIHFITSPSERVQLTVIGTRPSYVGFIPNPTEKVQLKAVEKRPECIFLLQKPAEKVQLTAVLKDPRYLSAIREPYAEIFKGSLAYLVGKCAFTLKSQSLPYHYGRNAEYFHQAFTNLFCYMNVLFHISLVLIINILVELGESNPTWLSSARQTCHSCGLSRGHPRPTLPTIQCSTQGLRVILQSFYLVYLRSNATSVAGHQPSYQSRHITFWCCKYDAVLFCIAETNTIHYQNHCHLVLHALRLPLL